MTWIAQLPGKRFIRRAARVHRQRIEAAADAGIGAEQINRPNCRSVSSMTWRMSSSLPTVASERRAIDRCGNRFRTDAVEIGDHHLGRNFAR